MRLHCTHSFGGKLSWSKLSCSRNARARGMRAMVRVLGVGVVVRVHGVRAVHECARSGGAVAWFARSREREAPKR